MVNPSPLIEQEFIWWLELRIKYVFLPFSVEGYLSVLGGQDSDKVTLSSGERYDPDTNCWSPIPSMNEVCVCIKNIIQ